MGQGMQPEDTIFFFTNPGVGHPGVQEKNDRKGESNGPKKFKRRITLGEVIGAKTNPSL